MHSERTDAMMNFCFGDKHFESCHTTYVYRHTHTHTQARMHTCTDTVDLCFGACSLNSVNSVNISHLACLSCCIFFSKSC